MRVVVVAAVAAALLAGSTVARAQPGTRHGLTAIKLAPSHARGSVGSVQYVTAHGTFADGNYRNITQQIEYRSSNPAVAVAKNERGQKSRIDLVGVGRATISAVDPLTGVTSTDSGGDMGVRVVGRAERLTIKPTEVQRAVGEFHHFTVIGHYAGGETRNLTQHCKYRTSDPSVALARNIKGDRSRVEAVGPGTATIVAVHMESGLTTDESDASATFTVLGALEQITLSPAHPRRAVGDIQHYTATGHYEGGAVRNMTQQVEYTTSDSAVATAPNADGDRSRIATVALGTVTISARDPVTGISSSDGGGDAKLTVYDPAAPKPQRAKAGPSGDQPPAVVCGDASGDGAIGLSDPLWIFAGAVGIADCPLAACDVDADGAVTTTDATTVGWAAVGSDVALNCRRSAGP